MSSHLVIGHLPEKLVTCLQTLDLTPVSTDLDPSHSPAALFPFGDTAVFVWVIPPPSAPVDFLKVPLSFARIVHTDLIFSERKNHSTRPPCFRKKSLTGHVSQA